MSIKDELLQQAADELRISWDEKESLGRKASVALARYLAAERTYEKLAATTEGRLESLQDSAGPLMVLNGVLVAEVPE